MFFFCKSVLIGTHISNRRTMNHWTMNQGAAKYGITTSLLGHPYIFQKLLVEKKYPTKRTLGGVFFVMFYCHPENWGNDRL